MKSIFKNSLLILMLHLVVITGYGQPVTAGDASVAVAKKYAEEIKKNQEEQKKKNQEEQKKKEQLLAEAKKNAGGIKILVLGDSYQPANELWLQLGSLNFKEQSDLLKEILLKNADVRKSAINDASMEVFGSSAEATDFAYWDAKILKEKKDGYATIVSANIARLNADKNKRELTIRVAYVTVFGREANAAELGKWMNSTAHYRIIYQSLISYMYSIEGANDLTAIVKATFIRNNQKYTDDQVIQRMMAAKAQKMDFMKMVSSF